MKFLWLAMPKNDVNLNAIVAMALENVDLLMTATATACANPISSGIRRRCIVWRRKIAQNRINIEASAIEC